MLSSILKYHLLQAHGFPKPLPADSSWLLFVFFSALCILAYLRVSYSRQLREVFKAAYDKAASRDLLREENILTRRFTLLLLLVFFASSSALIYQYLRESDSFQISDSYTFYTFLKIMGILILGFLGKILLLKSIGFILKKEQEISEYIFYIFLYSQVLGVFFLASSIFIAYSPIGMMPLLTIAIIFFGIAYLLRIFRGFRLAMSKGGLSKLYIIYYFCALELVPAAIITKILLDLRTLG